MSNPVDINTVNRKEHYRHILMNLKNLPSIPTVMMEISRLLDSPRTSAAELGRIIARDQGLVAKILTVANSPLYGLPRRVSTIEFAIVILGFDHIKNIVIALSMMEAFSSKSDKTWNRRAYWHHSLVTASASKRIADDLGYSKSGEAFTAGLLHDLGIAVIQRFLNKEYQEIVNKVETEGKSYLVAEEEVIGITHQEIGLILAERWNLPESLSSALSLHHSPSIDGNRELASIIHLADYMTQLFQIGNFDWDKNITLDQGIIQILHLSDEEYLQRIIDSYQPLFQNQLESLID